MTDPLTVHVLVGERNLTHEADFRADDALHVYADAEQVVVIHLPDDRRPEVTLRVLEGYRACDLCGHADEDSSRIGLILDHKIVGYVHAECHDGFTEAGA